MSVKVPAVFAAAFGSSVRRHGVVRTASVAVFECKGKSCAPPPVGTGGSVSTGATRARTAERKAILRQQGKEAFFKNLGKGTGARTRSQAADRERLSDAERSHYDRFRSGKKGVGHSTAVQMARRQAAADARRGKSAPAAGAKGAMETVRQGLARRKAERLDAARKEAKEKLGEMKPADIEGTSEKRHTNDPMEGARELEQGKVVKFDDGKTVNTMLDKLSEDFNAAERDGKKLPDVNLCKVSVPGTNLFCGDSFDIPRDVMPQFSGKPRKGSLADALPKNKSGEVDGVAAFKAHLTEQGIGMEKREVRAGSLKASQAQLSGEKVSGMMTNPNFDPAGEPIFVSSDGYVIDGHHRWAAQIARDLKDGNPNDLPLNVIVVDMPIKEVLVEANAFTSMYGILPKKVKAK